MAEGELDIDPFGEHSFGEVDIDGTDETTPLIPGMGTDINTSTRSKTQIGTGSKIDTLNKQIKKQIIDDIYNKISKTLGVEPKYKFKDYIETYKNGKVKYVNHQDIVELGTKQNIKTGEQLKKLLGVKRLRALGYTNINYLDIYPSKAVKKLNKNLPSTVSIKSASNEEVLEMVDNTIDNISQVSDELQQETSFIEGDELPSMRELLGLDNAVRTISGSLKLAVAKSVEVQNHIEIEYGKLEELNDPSYTDEQRQ